MVSSAVPKPANWRIVHNRPRYMLGYTPRVNGYSPGSPIALRSPADPPRVYSGRTGSPDSVVNDVGALRRRGVALRPRLEPVAARSLGSVAMLPIYRQPLVHASASQEKQCSAATRRRTSRIGSTAGAR